MRAMQRYTFRHILTPDGMLHDRTLTVGPDGRIAAIEPSAAGAVLDGWLALPGIPNAHSHAFQRALAGFGEATNAPGRDSFWSWREAMYRLALRVTPEQCGAIARHAFAEMLAAGYTSVAEFHYLHHLPEGPVDDGARGTEMAAAVIEAARAVGIRLTLLPTLYVTGGFGREAQPEQRRFLHASVDQYLGLVARLRPLLPDGRVGVAPHSLRAVPAELLAPLVAGARALLGADAPLHVHVAEQTAEVEQCRAAHGCGPIALLARHVELDTRWSLVHATHADARERALLRERGANLVVCPITEAYLGDGLYPVEEQGSAGIAIGSDSNCRIDALAELRLLEYGARLRNRARAQLADERGLGAPLWSGAVAAGARALGQPVAGLAVGQLADLVVVDERAPALAGHGIATALDALLINGSARDLSATIVGGRRCTSTDTRAAYDAAVRELLP